MSSTNRGGQRSEADNYPTPAWCVHRLLEDPHAQQHLPAGRWLEPGAGDGAIVRAAREVRSDIEWTALEYRAECRTDLIHAVGGGVVLIENYLIPPEGSKLVPGFAVAAGNPPYSLAEEFLARSLEVADTVVLLLRVNYLASGKRNSFMRKHTPDVYILPNRPSFRGKGTDSPEYAWLLWPKERDRSTGAMRILDTTPKNVRTAGRSTLPITGKRERKKQLKAEAATPTATAEV